MTAFLLFSVSMVGNSAEEIILQKENPTGPPRVPAPNPALFSATYDGILMTIYAENYTDSATVNIFGIDGEVTEIIDFSYSDIAIIDLSSLPEGVYNIFLTTNSGVFSGELKK